VATRSEADEHTREWPPRSLADRLTFLLKHAMLGVIAVAEPALDPFGIDGREFGVLLFFADEGSVSQQEAAQRLAIDRTTMVALIDGLEGKGLVERRPDPGDRRRNSVTLTGPGRRVLAGATRSVEDAERRFLAPLAAGDAERLTRMLQALVTAGAAGAGSAAGAGHVAPGHE
jgi:DNA-binding MarR family transcriptional regulator